MRMFRPITWEREARTVPPSPKALLRSQMAARPVVHIADTTAEEGYVERSTEYVAAVELGGVRTIIAVPMLKESELIGGFLIARQEARPFTEKQIELVTSFAAQAVIAIENTRLLNELRQRTNDLTERTADLTKWLEQQTATSEVLHVISSLPGDLQLVFEAMLEKAVRVCEAKFGSLYRWDGDALQLVLRRITCLRSLLNIVGVHHFVQHRRLPAARMVATKAVVHVCRCNRPEPSLHCTK